MTSTHAPVPYPRPYTHSYIIGLLRLFVELEWWVWWCSGYVYALCTYNSALFTNSIWMAASMCGGRECSAIEREIRLYECVCKWVCVWFSRKWHCRKGEKNSSLSMWLFRARYSTSCAYSRRKYCIYAIQIEWDRVVATCIFHPFCCSRIQRTSHRSFSFLILPFASQLVCLLRGLSRFWPKMFRAKTILSAAGPLIDTTHQTQSQRKEFFASFSHYLCGSLRQNTHAFW